MFFAELEIRDNLKYGHVLLPFYLVDCVFSCFRRRDHLFALKSLRMQA